jgi:hypothetical protein
MKYNINVIKSVWRRCRKPSQVTLGAMVRPTKSDYFAVPFLFPTSFAAITRRMNEKLTLLSEPSGAQVKPSSVETDSLANRR